MTRRRLSTKLAVVSAACLVLAVQLVPPASAAGPPTRIDCVNPDVNAFDRPEHAYRPSQAGTESNAPFTCTVRDSADQLVGAGAVVRGEATSETGSVNDPDDGTSFASPDYTCTTGANGTCLVTVTQSENQIGHSTICFFLSPASAATQCANEEYLHDDVDNADEVRVTWETRDPAKGGLDAEPETVVTPLGSSHAVAATIYDQFGLEWVGNRTVHFELYAGSPSDPDESTSTNTPDYTCVTSASATCSVTFSGNTLGRDMICVFTNRAPTLTGSNTWPTCSGRENDVPGVFDAPEVPTANHDGVEIWWQEQDLIAGGLDAEPETSIVPARSKPVISVKVHDDEGAPRPGAVVFYEFIPGSISTDEDGRHLIEPDGRCVTSATGICSISFKQVEGLGSNWICIWVNGYPVIDKPLGQPGDVSTCDGEGLTDADDQAGVFDDPVPVDDDMDLVKVKYAKPKGG